MRSASAALVTWMTTAKDTLAFDLWTFTLQSGVVLRWTNADAQQKDEDGNVYACGPVITRSMVTWKRGVETDTVTATLSGDAGVLVSGVPLAQFAAQGGFTAAQVTLRRAFFDPATLALQGALNWFVGQVADVDSDRYATRLQIKDLVANLSLQMPRNLYQASCINTLFDAGCGLPREAYAVKLSAFYVDSAASYLSARYTGKPTGYFALGVLRFTSGKNAGIGRSIKAQSTFSDRTDFALSRPFPFPLELDATFKAYPGCDKSTATCGGTFGNLVRFAGEPWIPDASTVT